MPPQRRREVKTSVGPSVTAEQGVRLLRVQREKALALLSGRPVQRAVCDAWDNTTREFLIKCFGEGSGNLQRFDWAGAYDIPPTGAPPDESDANTLRKKLYILASCIEQLDAQLELAPAADEPSREAASGVFLVHGRNEGVQETVARFVESLGLRVTILHEQPNAGRTLIEKFEDHSDVGFAVVLLTADDVGGLRGAPADSQRPRARQNVILELGFFLGKLKRRKVCALYEDGVELPSDYDGVAFVPLDAAGAWRLKLAKELKVAGLPVDL